MGVDPSSLIFVVIVGIWAVYLLQHWVRRREQLATSRSIDRFSEAMRVLERRAPVPVALPPSRSIPSRSYVVAPSAAAVRAGRESPMSSEVAMKQAAMSRDNRLAAAPGVARSRGAGAARAGRPAMARRTHRLRAVVLLTLLGATPACWAAHVWGTLLLWPTLTVTGLLVLDLLYVRAVARRASARRRMARRRMTAGPAPRRRTAPATAQLSSFPAPLAGSGRTSRPTPDSAADERIRTALPSRSSTLVADRAPSVHSQDAITEVIVLEGGWEPVAVPPPTYTMKPKADRPAEPAAVLAADSDSAPARQSRESVEPGEPVQPAITIDELDLDSVLERRRAAGE